MSTFTTTREQLHSAAQKAGDAYALARRVQEQVGALVARVEAAERDLSGAFDRIADLEAENNRLRAVPAPTPRRKAA